MGIKTRGQAMYNKRVKFLLFSPVFLFSIPFLVDGFTFSQTLSLGDENSEVLELQKALNVNPKTQIASTGAGSPGNETNYFGLLTLRSVVAFQDLYREEILIPAGLSGGTGIVGPLTRAKLNALKTSAPTANVNTIQTISSLIPQTPLAPSVTTDKLNIFLKSIFQNSPKVLSLSRYQVEPGDRVMIIGANFTPSHNTVYFPGIDTAVSGLVSPNEQTLEFTVPLDMPFGSYNLSVSNSNGSSFNDSFGGYFNVVKEARDLPKIISISPQSLDPSTERDIIIKGEHFDKKNNTVFSSLGAVHNISSADGKTIEIKLDAFPSFSQIDLFAEQAGAAQSVKLFFQVQTPAGFSLENIPVSLLFK